MAAGAIKAGKAMVQLTLGDKGFAGGLKKAGAKLKAFGSSVGAMGRKLAGVGVAMLGPLVGATAVFMKMGDHMAKMSARTGIAVESLSALAYAAKQSGTSIETLEKGIMKMNRSILDGTRGLSTQVEAFGQLGLNAADLAGMAPDEAFKTIAQALSQIDDPGKKAALAMMIFGNAGADLLPLMNDGAGGIDALMDKAEELGIVMSGEDAAAAAELTDRMSDLWEIMKMAVFTIGSALAPALTAAATWLQEFAKKVGDFVKENKALVIMYAKIALAIVGAGVAFMVFGGIISALGTVFAALGTIISATIGIIALLFTPLGIVVGMTAAIIGVTVGWGNVTKQLVSVTKTNYDSIGSIARDTFDGIKDAMAAGDWKLAAKIAWTGIKSAWTTGTMALREAWVGFKGWWRGMVSSMGTWFQKQWTSTVAHAKTGWAKLKGWFMGENEKVTAARIDRIYADRNKASKKLDDENKAAHDKINADVAAQMKTLQDEEDAARAELDRLRAQAKQAREDREAELAQDDIDIPDIEIPDVKIPGVEQFNASVKSLNTLSSSASAAGRMAQNMTRQKDEQIAEATRRGAEAAEELVRLWKAGKKVVSAFAN